MVRYRCNVCQVFEYDSKRGDSVTGIPPGTEPAEFPEGWKCPICSSDRTHLERLEIKKEAVTATEEVTCPVCGATHTIAVSHIGREEIAKYLGKWERHTDDLEVHMAHIRKISSTGASIIEPMRTRQPVPSWNEILFLGAQLARLPLNPDESVNTRTVIGPGAALPMVIETPIYVTHMSFGALSREVKMALARGSAANRTAIGSGEGGILPEEREAAYRYIFEYVPNRYSVTEENLRTADAIEIKVGQSSKPGMGALLPAEKVTEEIAAIRGFSPGHDIASPARFPDINTPADLAAKVSWLREVSGGRPIGIKIAAGHLEADLAVVVEASPDFVTIDGRPGGTAASPKFVKDSTSIPTLYALPRARRFLDEAGANEISLVATGGLRVSSDVAKALALGADAVAIGTAALMACGCQQYRLCDTGTCPVGVTTQTPRLRERLRIDISARQLEHFLRVSTEELQTFARLCGHHDVHALSPSDLATTSTEIARTCGIPHAGQMP